MTARKRGDAIAVLLLLVFLMLALGIRDAVADLGQMGAQIAVAGSELRDSGRATGDEIRSSFGDAAAIAGSLPLVGENFANTLREAGDRNAAVIESQAVEVGTDLLRSGRQGEDDANRLADLLGLLIFLVGATIVLGFWLPRRRALAP